MSAGRWVLTIVGSLFGLSIGALVGLYLLSRHDVRKEFQKVTGTKPAVWLVGLPGDGGRFRFRYTVMYHVDYLPVHVDWCLWPFREVRRARPYAINE